VRKTIGGYFEYINWIQLLLIKQIDCRNAKIKYLASLLLHVINPLFDFEITRVVTKVIPSR